MIIIQCPNAITNFELGINVRPEAVDDADSFMTSGDGQGVATMQLYPINDLNLYEPSRRESLHQYGKNLLREL